MPHREHALGWPSVTQVLGDYNKSWLEFFYKKYGTVDAAKAYAKSRAEVGDRCHLALEVLLNGGDEAAAVVKVNEDEQEAIRALAKQIRMLDVQPVASERELESKTFQYHGSLDGLVRIGNPSQLPNEDFLGEPVAVNPGVLTIMDLKTKENSKPLQVSEMKKHAMQMAAYGHAVGEEDGEAPELGLIIQLDIPTAQTTLHAAYPLSRYFRPFTLQREMWDYINGRCLWASKKRRGRKPK